MARTTTWRVREIDAGTWLPVRELACVESVSIKKAVGKDEPLMESADMRVTGELTEGYYRIEMLDSDGVLRNVATLLFCPDGAEYEHGTWGRDALGKSVLTGAAERLFCPGDYAPKGVDGAQWCANLLASDIPAPVNAEGEFFLDEHFVFDINSTHLDGIWQVLDAGGFCMQIQGDGTVVIKELPTEPYFYANSTTASLLMPKFGRSLPISDVPNSLTVYDGDQEVTVVNDDPASPTSTVERGRVIEAREESPIRKEGETLYQYASRRLSELSDVYETISVEREHVEGLLPYSVVRANLPAQSIDGDFRVMATSVECELGLKAEDDWGRRADGDI